MTATHRSNPCQPTALGRRLQIMIAVLVLSALGLAVAAPSQAAAGSVYFDAD